MVKYVLPEPSLSNRQSICLVRYVQLSLLVFASSTERVVQLYIRGFVKLPSLIVDKSVMKLYVRQLCVKMYSTALKGP